MTQPRMVGDRYELGELIGYGGMAEVHRGRDIRLNRDVAIKILRPDLARDPSFLNRFRREAHSAAGLNHPSIVSVYDTGEDTGPDGATLPFIVMEIVEGRTLRDIVKSEGSLPPRRAMEITADICAALEFSHRNGIIHRDIKPANVMITPQGAVKVMDFGIARAVADTSSTVTQTANVIGTAQYLSPEQARGETVDARSDVYSSGCLLYELITGGPPFQGDSPVAVAYQHVRENPVMPSARKPGIPRELDSIVMKALAKNQLNRYQSAGEMRSDLQRALADQPVVAEAVMTDAERTQFIARTPPPTIAPRREEYVAPAGSDARHTGLIWAAVVVALLLVVGIGAFVILTGGGSNSNTATVPKNLQGMTAQQVKDALTNVDLQFKNAGTTTGPCNAAQPQVVGGACTFKPPPGQPVDKNSVVTVGFYAKPKAKAVQVPSVIGAQVNDAKKTLTGLGIDPKDIVTKSVNKLDVNGNATANEVLAQKPQAYDLLNPGDKITLEVATGKLVLPAVKGKTLEAAKTALNDAGFVNHVVVGTAKTGTNKKLDGTVVGVDPTANGKIAYAPDTTITLTPYQYLKPKPTCTTAPPSPSPSPSSSSKAPPSGSAGPSVPPSVPPIVPPSSAPSGGSTGLPTC